MPACSSSVSIEGDEELLKHGVCKGVPRLIKRWMIGGYCITIFITATSPIACIVDSGRHGSGGAPRALGEAGVGTVRDGRRTATQSKPTGEVALRHRHLRKKRSIFGVGGILSATVY